MSRHLVLFPCVCVCLFCKSNFRTTTPTLVAHVLPKPPCDYYHAYALGVRGVCIQYSTDGASMTKIGHLIAIRCQQEP